MIAVVAYIGLGSNLDNPAGHVQAALRDIAATVGVRLLQHSRLYRTAPWGVIEQPEFVNAVAAVETSLSARDLLNRLLSIEREHGRQRVAARWGPRLIDLDLLLYGNQRIRESGLEVPHPRMGTRAFVLVPLAELAPGLVIPGQGRVDQLAASVSAESCVPLGPPT